MADARKKIKHADMGNVADKHHTSAVRVNPLAFSGVTRTFCQFLNQLDIKSCRIVSREWNSTAKISLALRSKIDLSSRMPFCFTDFQKIFSESLNYQLITTVEMFGVTILLKTIPELNNFFRSYKTMTNLTLGHLHIKDEQSELLTTFDITPWVEHSQFANPKCVRNTKLNVKGSEKTTRMQISLHALVHIKEISLEYCEVYVVEEKSEKLNPVKISITDIKFVKDGLPFLNFPISDFLSLSRTKDLKLIINDLVQNSIATSIVLDFRGKEIIFEEALLINIGATNFQACSWVTGRLHLQTIPFEFPNKMQITRLNFCEAELDLAVLPQTIEYLELVLRPNTEIYCSQPLALQRLKHLNIYFYLDLDDSVLLHFQNCKQLKTLDMESCTTEKLNFSCRYVPKSVKEMKLLQVNLPDVQQEVVRDLKLEKMVLFGYSFNEAKDIYNTGLPIEELQLDYLDMTQDTPTSFQEFLELHAAQNFVGYVVAGPFRWEGNNFATSVIANYVDREATYYRFDNERGVAVNERDYDMWDV